MDDRVREIDKLAHECAEAAASAWCGEINREGNYGRIARRITPILQSSSLVSRLQAAEQARDAAIKSVGETSRQLGAAEARIQSLTEALTLIADYWGMPAADFDRKHPQHTQLDLSDGSELSRFAASIMAESKGAKE